MIRSTWAIPVLIAVTTLAGLVSALTGDGLRDAAAWIALAMPVAATGWAMRRAGLFNDNRKGQDLRDSSVAAYRFPPRAAGRRAGAGAGGAAARSRG